MVPDPLAITGIFLLGASAGALATYVKLRGALVECRRALEMVRGLPETVAERTLHVGPKALIIARDTEVISVFSTLLREKRIHVEKSFAESTALGELSQRKFEILVLDFDSLPECSYVLPNLPNPNRQAFVIAIASDPEERERAIGLGARLVVGHPLDLSKVREFLGLSYGRILRDSQAYFRLAIQLPVSIQRASGSMLFCTTLNLSQNGMAVTTPDAFNVGEEVEIKFEVPDNDATLQAEGNVIWDDKHGKAGIRFQCKDSAVQALYFAWLHDQFVAMREITPSQSHAREEAVYAG